MNKRRGVGQGLVFLMVNGYVHAEIGEHRLTADEYLALLLTGRLPRATFYHVVTEGCCPHPEGRDDDLVSTGRIRRRRRR